MTSPPPPAGCNNWGAIFCVVHPIIQEASRMDKRPIAPAKLRRVPQQFSWVDQRLVRERYIDQLSPPACALYLFLVTVADAQGLSWEHSVILTLLVVSVDSAQTPDPK